MEKSGGQPPSPHQEWQRQAQHESSHRDLVDKMPQAVPAGPSDRCILALRAAAKAVC